MDTNLSQRRSILLILLAISVALALLTMDYPFYWDNVVQISIPANFYFDTNFTQFYLPDSIATGHPTFVGMYIASCWKILGRTIFVSHLALFPFVFGLLYQLYQLIRNLKVDNTFTIISMLGIVILDTTVLSQLSLITFDVIQLFFFLLCVNLIITRRRLMFSLCYLLLMMISLRGALIGFGLILSEFILVGISKKNRFEYYKFLPGLIALIVFLAAFKYNKGWIVHNTISENWESSSEFAAISEMLRNMIAMGWQLTDYGRIVPYAILTYLTIRLIRRRSFEDTTVKTLFTIGLCQLVLLAPILIIYKNSFGHRYFLPTIIPFSLLVGYWVVQYSNYSKTFVLVIFSVLISGHFWIYPLKMSQGWDATTLHWSYLKNAKKMHSYILTEKINTNEIATFFPAYKSRRHTHLEVKDLAYSGVAFKAKYLFFSNAFNVTDDEVDQLFSKQSEWKLTKQFKSRGVYVKLYQKIK